MIFSKIEKCSREAAGRRISMFAVVEELLASDLVVLDCINSNLFERDAFSVGLSRYFEGEVHGKLIGAVEVRTSHLFAMDFVVALPDARLLNDRPLSGGFLAVTLHGDDIRGVHRLHHVKVLALVAHVHEFSCDSLDTHGYLL